MVCHIEWIVTDFSRSRKFYEGLFEWKFQEFGDDMVVFGLGDHHIGGFQRADSVTPGNSPSVWIEADDVEAYCAKATTLGGTVIAGKRPVPHVGWSAIVGDPDGNAVGLVQFDRS